MCRKQQVAGFGGVHIEMWGCGLREEVWKNVIGQVWCPLIGVRKR